MILPTLAVHLFGEVFLAYNWQSHQSRQRLEAASRADDDNTQKRGYVQGLSKTRSVNDNYSNI